MRGTTLAKTILVTGALVLAACSRTQSPTGNTTSPPSPASNATSTDPSSVRPNEAILDASVLMPVTFGCGFVLNDTTVSQIETYLGGPGGPTHWRKVSDDAYILDADLEKNDLTGEQKHLSLELEPAPPACDLPGREHWVIYRGLMDGSEASTSDIVQLLNSVYAAKIPLTAGSLARENAEHAASLAGQEAQNYDQWADLAAGNAVDAYESSKGYSPQDSTRQAARAAEFKTAHDAASAAERAINQQPAGGPANSDANRANEASARAAAAAAAKQALSQAGDDGAGN